MEFSPVGFDVVYPRGAVGEGRGDCTGDCERDSVETRSGSVTRGVRGGVEHYAVRLQGSDETGTLLEAFVQLLAHHCAEAVEAGHVFWGGGEDVFEGLEVLDERLGGSVAEVFDVE